MGRIGGVDYELRWPRELLIAEIDALIERGWEADPSRVEPLLTGAFCSAVPWSDFNAAGQAGGGGWGRNAFESTGRTLQPTKDEFLERLREAATSLPEHSAPKAYWPERHGLQDGQGQPVVRDTASAKRRFARLVRELENDGYLDSVFPKGCVDDESGLYVDRDDFLQERLGIGGLWPLVPDDWSEPVFFGLIEVFHDCVARPRTRTWHSWNQCGWHVSDLAIEPGRALYVWKVNRLLATSGIDLALASKGEDAGRLVHTFDEVRDNLIEEALQAREPDTRARVAHAVALFRGRTASEHDKRSATIALAAILEERRALLKAELLRADEGALFRIANEFSIRHHRDGQRRNYDAAFLDWIFWWYLATVELTERLLSRA